MSDIKLELNNNGILTETKNSQKIINDNQYQLNHQQYQQFIGNSKQTIYTDNVFNLNFGQTNNFSFKPSWNYFDKIKTIANNNSNWGIDQYQIAGGTYAETKSQIQQRISEILIDANESIQAFKNYVNKKLNQIIEPVQIPNTNLADTSQPTAISPSDLFAITNNHHRARLQRIFEKLDCLFEDIQNFVYKIGHFLNRNYKPITNLSLARGFAADVFTNPNNQSLSPYSRLCMIPNTNTPAICLITSKPELKVSSTLAINHDNIIINSSCNYERNPQANIIVNGEESEIIMGIRFNHYPGPLADHFHVAHYHPPSSQFVVNKYGIGAITEHALLFHAINLEETSSSSALFDSNSIALFCGNSDKTPTGIQILNNSVSIFKQSNRVLHAQNNNVIINGHLTIKNNNLYNFNNNASNLEIYRNAESIRNRIISQLMVMELNIADFYNENFEIEHHENDPEQTAITLFQLPNNQSGNEFDSDFDSDFDSEFDESFSNEDITYNSEEDFDGNDPKNGG